MPISAEWFKEWFNSPYYHQLYASRDEREAQKLISQLIKKLNPVPGSRVFDVGCGRGRHSRIFAELGFDVTGIDIAPDNIVYAKQFENDHLHFYQHDMRLPAWINFFDQAFSFFTSFGFFKTRREHLDAIRTISQSLKPGGHFVIDYINPIYTEAHLVPDSQKNVGTTTFFLTKWADEKHFFKKIRIEDKALAGPITFTERIEKFSLDDFRGMLATQNMQIKEVCGDYDLNTYDEKESPRLLIIAQKQ